jgi:hypothetical protein
MNLFDLGEEDGRVEGRGAWLSAAKVLFPRPGTVERVDMGNGEGFKRQQGRAAMLDQERSDDPDASAQLVGLRPAWILL